MPHSNRLSRRCFLRMVGVNVTGALLLAACSAASPTDERKVDRAPAVDKVVLTVGHHWETAFRPLQEAFDQQYVAQHPEIAFQYIYNTWSEHNQLVPTWAAAKTLPDLIYVHGGRAFPWAFEGILVSLQDYVDQDEAFNVQGIWEEALRLYRFQGNLVGIPYDHGAIILGYNKDLFDTAGEAYPDDRWTMDTFREVAQRLTKATDVQPQWGWSGALPDFGNGGNDCMLRPWGAQLLNENEEQFRLDTPAATEAVQFWVNLLQVDQSAPTPAQAQTFEGGAFLAGRVAMDTLASWNTPTLKQAATFAWDVAAWPQARQQGCGAFGSGFSITRDCTQPAAAWQYLSAYLSTEGMETLWGQSGRGSPARKAAYGAWLTSPNAPTNAQAYLDALDTYAVTSSPFQTLAAAAINELCAQQAWRLRTGETTVAVALATIMGEGQPLLDAATARVKA